MCLVKKVLIVFFLFQLFSFTGCDFIDSLLMKENPDNGTEETDDGATDDNTNENDNSDDTDTTPPAEVTNFTATPGDCKITLSWDNPSGDDFDHCQVFYSDNINADTEFSDTIAPSETIISGLTNGKDYTVSVKTVDSIGNISEGVQKTVTLEYNIGDTGPSGGLIFYDDEADGIDNIETYRYLEAAPKSTEFGTGMLWVGDEEITWGPTTIACQATETAVGTGYQNTVDITDSISGYYAAVACRTLNCYGGGWYLPSKDELNLMYQNLHLQGLGSFESYGYWSSTEYPQLEAYYQDFSDGSQGKRGKGAALYARAVRGINPYNEVRSFSATAGENEVTLSWHEPIDSDFDHIEIYYGTGNDPDNVLLGNLDRVGTKVTGLTNDTEYTFLIKTVDTEGEASIGVTATAAPSNMYPPSEVSELVTSVDDEEVSLTWVNPPEDDFNHCEIVYSAAGVSETSILLSPSNPSERQSYTVTGLDNGTEYALRVKTVDTAENASRGMVIYETPYPVEDQYPILQVEQPANQIGKFVLKWSYGWGIQSGSNDNYELQQSFSSDSGFETIAMTREGVNWSPFQSAFYADMSESAGKTLYFRVRGISGSWESDFSNVVSVDIPELQQSITLSPDMDNGVVTAESGLTEIHTNDVYAYDQKLMIGDLYIQNAAMGYWDYMYTHAALWFDTGQYLNGRTVNSAVITLQISSLPGTSGGYFRVAPIANSWQETSLTFNTLDIYTDHIYTFNEPVTSVLYIDVTSIVQAWANGVISNNGFVLWDNHTLASAVIDQGSYGSAPIFAFEFYTSDAGSQYAPQLSIEFSD